MSILAADDGRSRPPPLPPAAVQMPIPRPIASLTEAYVGHVSEAVHDVSITDTRDRLADVVNEAAYTGQATY